MPIWLQILIAVLGAIGTIFGAIGVTAYFAERAKHKAQKKNDAEDKKEAEEAEKQQKLDELEQNEIMNNLAEALADILLPKLKNIVAEEIAPVKHDLGLVKAGVQDTCRYDLDELTSKADAQGWLSKYDKQRYEHMYNAYHDLGVNGVMTAAYERVMHLPDRPPIKPKKNSKK